MNNLTNSNNTRSDGMWAFFILTFVLMILTWGALAIFQMPVASAANTDAPTSALAMALYFLAGSPHRLPVLSWHTARMAAQDCAIFGNALHSSTWVPGGTW